MVKNIKIDAWSFPTPINRETFNKYIVNLISGYIDSKDQIEKITLTFPTCLTKSQRHDIHKLSLYYEFVTASYDTQDGRFIGVALSKNYLNNLNFNFPQLKIKSDKQILFDSLIQFIQNNLSIEFGDFLNKI